MEGWRLRELGHQRAADLKKQVTGSPNLLGLNLPGVLVIYMRDTSTSCVLQADLTVNDWVGEYDSRPPVDLIRPTVTPCYGKQSRRLDGPLRLYRHGARRRAVAGSEYHARHACSRQAGRLHRPPAHQSVPVDSAMLPSQTRASTPRIG